MHFSLDKITIDAGTQSRVSLDKHTIAEYAEAMKDGAKFTPCLVISDGTKHYLVDGFHRYFAARKIGAPGIECDVQEGTLDDAIIKSWSVNSKHGLRPTVKDRRKSVLNALSHPRTKSKPSREIAVLCDCSHSLVLKVKQELEEKKQSNKSQAAPTLEENPKLEETPSLEEIPNEDDVFQEEMQATIELLKAENEALSDKLAIAAMDADELDKAMAESVIKDLRAQIRLLEIELKGVTDSRDSLLRENNQLMNQVASLTKKLKKLEQ